MKVETKRVAAAIDLFRVALLDDSPVFHDGDAVCKAERFFLVMRDEDERAAERAMDAAQFRLHRLPQFEIERAERLVEQQHLRAA